MLVESTRHAPIVERGRVVGNGVGELVPDNVNAAGEVVEEVIPISENHLVALRIPDYPCVSGFLRENRNG